MELLSYICRIYYRINSILSRLIKSYETRILNGKKFHANVWGNEMWINLNAYETFALRKTKCDGHKYRSDIKLGSILTAFIRAISLCQLPLPPHLTSGAKH